MKFIGSAFSDDVLYLTRWELIKLFCGITLHNGPLYVKVNNII
jgi:hypothetical protein